MPFLQRRFNQTAVEARAWMVEPCSNPTQSILVKRGLIWISLSDVLRTGQEQAPNASSQRHNRAEHFWFSWCSERFPIEYAFLQGRRCRRRNYQFVRDGRSLLGLLSSCPIFKSNHHNSFQDRASFRFHLRVPDLQMSCRLRLYYGTRYQDSCSPSNDRQAVCPISCQHFLWEIDFVICWGGVGWGCQKLIWALNFKYFKFSSLYRIYLSMYGQDYFVDFQM